MDFISPELANYCERHTSPENDLLYQLNRQTHLKVMMPRMLSGHLQGRFLSMLSHMIKPQAVLEIGTYTGYSALCLAEGISQGGKLLTLDINAELEGFVRPYFEKSPYAQIIDYRIGNALDLIPGIDIEFDMVFIDADKINYQRYYDLVLPKVKTGGFIIADNVLWSGKILDEGKTDKDTQALKTFNDYVMADAQVENVMAPVRDGLLIIRKK